MAVLSVESAWETQCFISAAVFGSCVIAVVSTSMARRATGISRRRCIAMTVLIAIVFVAALAVIFASVEPCAQGPA